MDRIDLTNVKHHPAVSDIVDVLCSRTRKQERGYFQAVTAYYLCKMAASMRATIVMLNNGTTIPVNAYTVALAPSGFGKGITMGVLEDEYLGSFRERFVNHTLPILSDAHHWAMANEKATRDGTEPQDEYDKIVKDYGRYGSFPFAFSEGSTPAVKQVRDLLILSNCGSINFEMDEVGSYLKSNVEIMNAFLELYDQGKIKMKITKDGKDSKRGNDLMGKTPTNLLLFGTPAKLFDDGETESTFYSLLDTGYARRCLFGHGSATRERVKITPEEDYNSSIRVGGDAEIAKWANYFHNLADPAMAGWRIEVDHQVGIALTAYRHECEDRALAYGDHEEILRAEMMHRYFKALKLAGAYAFIDRSNEVEMDHLLSAILLVEDSGAAFKKIMHRDSNHVKLGKYLASCKEPVTKHNLVENCPYYKRAQKTSQEHMLDLAISWGYESNVIIKKTYGRNNIEFFKAETLKPTDLSKIKISYSDHLAFRYESEEAPFEELHQLTQAADQHWCNHRFKNNHRSEENVIPGFNMLVLDVDGGVKIDLAHELLKDTKFMTYTTKRHQVVDPKANPNGDDRFRLLIPINFELEMDKADYKEMVQEVINWLPFKTGMVDDANVDQASTERSRKWMSHDGGTFHYNLDGELFDILPFIPKTSKNEEFKKEFKAVASLDNLERWFASRMANGNRNNQMIKFALALVDSGLDLVSISNQVHAFNKKLADPLDEAEIDRTVMQTVARRLQSQAPA